MILLIYCVRLSILASRPLFSIAFFKSFKNETPLVSMALTAEKQRKAVCNNSLEPFEVHYGAIAFFEIFKRLPIKQSH